MENITFIASLDGTVKNAVAFDSHGAGSIKLSTTEKELPQVMKLGAFFRGKNFEIKIKALEESLNTEENNGKAKTYSG